MANEFSTYYKKLSNTQLLDIINHENDYQPLAIEAAKQEFEARQLSETDIRIANDLLQTKRLESESKQEKVRQLENMARKIGDTLVDALNPVQEVRPSANRLIIIISISFSIILLYSVLSDFRMFAAMVRDIPNCDFSCIYYFMPHITITVATVLFWLRRPIGWLLMLFFVIHTSAWSGLTFINSLSWQASGIPSVDYLFPEPNPLEHLIVLIIMIGIATVLCKNDLRNIYEITKEKMIMAISLSCVLTFLLIYAII